MCRVDLQVMMLNFENARPGSLTGAFPLTVPYNVHCKTYSVFNRENVLTEVISIEHEYFIIMNK